MAGDYNTPLPLSVNEVAGLGKPPEFNGLNGFDGAGVGSERGLKWGWKVPTNPHFRPNPRGR